jgi:hypothetical protein
MENNYYKRDFEELVKSSADQYRMFPSEKVWKGIHSKLHTRRRWYGAGLAFLLLSIGTVTWVMLTNPSSNKNATNGFIAHNNAAKKNDLKKEKKEEVFIAPKLTQKQSDANKTNSTLPVITTSIETEDEQNIVADIKLGSIITGELNTVAAVATAVSSLASEVPELLKENLPAKTPAITIVAKATRPELVISTSPAQVSDKLPNVIATSEIKATPAITDNDIDLAFNNQDNNNQLTNAKEEAKPKAAGLISGTQAPYTIESVVNSYLRRNNTKKSYWQIYFAPTVTYRSLKENTAFIKAARAATSPINSNSPVPITYTLADLEHVVTHKADIGFQLGTSFGYPISKRLRFVTGFQFNVNKYDIKAYGHTTEVATISLNTLGRRSSVSTVTSYRVIGGGNNVDWLRNFYFSASVPVGLEYIVAKTKKTYVGVGGNLQPTYVLDNKSYLVSTDYKNYAQVPSLTRHWNVNTGFEVFAGIINKKSEWRISPQVRYQTLSSYKNTYPVKENLFDFGIKMGIILK